MHDRDLSRLQSKMDAFDKLAQWTVEDQYEKERRLFLKLFKYASHWPSIVHALEVDYVMKNKYFSQSAKQLLALDEHELEKQFTESAMPDETLAINAGEMSRGGPDEKTIDAYIGALRDARREREVSLRYLHRRLSSFIAQQRDIELCLMGVDQRLDVRSKLTRLIHDVSCDVDILERYKKECESPEKFPNALPLDQQLLPR